MIKNKEKKNLGIYLHIPFCMKKCHYCDFLSAPADENTKERYIEALKKEIFLYREDLKENIISTIFLFEFLITKKDILINIIKYIIPINNVLFCTHHL